MNNVNKTLFIPLYGKAYVSKKGLFLSDGKAEEIWKKEGFALKGKSKSKWLAYYMGIRSAVFDGWVTKQLSPGKDTVVLHIGCGMDSRILRVGNENVRWYDVDFPEVIGERKKYFKESENYRMIEGDIRTSEWLNHIQEHDRVIVVM
jgi:O-methyltransferase involved in polyketide biosynthesis